MNRHYHIYTLIIFEVVEESDDVRMAKSWPDSQLSRHELLLVIARSSDTVDYSYCSQLEVASRIECFFHLHVSAKMALFFHFTHVWQRPYSDTDLTQLLQSH